MAYRVFRYISKPTYWPATATVYVGNGAMVDEYVTDENNIPTLVGSTAGFRQYDTYADFPDVGRPGQMYIDLSDSNKAYIYTNGNYELVNGGIGSGDVTGPASSVDSTVAVFDGTTGKLIKDSGVTLSGTNTGNETASTLGATITGAATATLDDTDEVPIVESGVVKKSTWAAIKAFLKTYFDTIYNLYTHPNHTGDVTSTGDGATELSYTAITNQTLVAPNAADSFLISDASDSGALKRIVIGDLPGSAVFATNLTVGLPSPKTFGRYGNGDEIPAAGLTANEVVQLAIFQEIPPTLTLLLHSSTASYVSSNTATNANDSVTPATSVIRFNTGAATSNRLDFTNVINSLGASIATLSLEWRRNGTGAWTEIENNTAATYKVHAVGDSDFNTQTFNYRLTVTDDAPVAGTMTIYLNVTIQAYVAPTVSSFSAGSTPRELGNNVSTFSGTITKQSTNVAMTSYQLQYKINGSGSWIDIGSPVALSGSSQAISGVTHNGSSDAGFAGLVNSSSLLYQLKIIDAYQTYLASSASVGSVTISFLYRSVLGYSTVAYNTGGNPITIAIISGFSTHSAFTNSKDRTIAGVTASGTEYCYYVYAASSGDITSCLQDSAYQVIGGWEKLTDVTSTNAYGANVTYRIWKTIDPGAFTSNSLNFD